MPYELTLDSPLSFVRGVGETRLQQFAKRGVRTVGELLTYYPRAYEDRGNVLPLRDCADGGIHAVEVVCMNKPVSGRARSAVPALANGRRQAIPAVRTGFDGALRRGNGFAGNRAGRSG